MPQTHIFSQEQEGARKIVDGVRTVLAQLPHNIYRLGIDQEIAIERLLLSARPNGHPIAHCLSEVLAHIAPIVCKSPEQQAQFAKVVERYCRSHYDQHSVSVVNTPERKHVFLTRQSSSAAGKERGDPVADAAIRRHARQKSTKKLLFTGITLLVFAIGLGFLFQVSLHDPQQAVVTSPQESAPQKESAQWSYLMDSMMSGLSTAQRGLGGGLYLRWLVALLPLAGAVLIIRHRSRLQRFIERRLTQEEPQAKDSLRINPTTTDFFGGDVRKRLLPLKTPHILPSGALDLQATLKATLRAGGRAVLCFSSRRFSSEYLIISRKLTDLSHLDYIGTLLVNTLQKEEVHVRHYAFWREGVRLVDVRQGSSDGAADHNIHDLVSLSTRYPSHRLIILDEARHVIGQRGQVASWAEGFKAWPNKIWLTPLHHSRWGRGEEEVQNLGFQIISLYDSDPLSGLGKAFAGIVRSVESALSDKAPGKFPALLSQYSEEYEAEEPPSADSVTTLIDEIKEYLDPQSFRWLEACAVFPQLTPQLTLHLGNRLRVNENSSIYSLSRYTALARLPWFKTGVIPDWLRKRLIEGMPEGWCDHVRDVITEILTPGYVANGGEVSIEVIRRYRRRLVDSIADKLRGQSADQRIRSRLMIDFLHHKPSLSFGLPQWLFNGWRELATPDSLVIVVIGLLSSLLVFGLYDNFTESLSFWLHDFFSRLDMAVLTAVKWGTAILSLAHFTWWSVDVIRKKDGRLNWRWLSFVSSGVLLVLSLFVFFWFIAQYSYQPVNVQQSSPESFPSVQYFLSTLAFLGCAAAYIRGVVSPVLPPRIAVTPIFEGLGRISMLCLWGRFGFALLLGTVLFLGGLALLDSSPLSEQLGLFMMVNYHYPFSLPMAESDLYSLRPTLSLPWTFFILIASIRPILGSWKLVRQMIVGSFLGLLIAETIVGLVVSINPTINKAALMLISTGVISILGGSGACLILYRQQLLQLKPMVWFIGCVSMIYFGNSLWIGNIVSSGSEKLDGYFISLVSALLTPLACFLALRMEGARVFIVSSIGKVPLALLLCTPMMFLFSFIATGVANTYSEFEAELLYVWLCSSLLLFYPLVWLKLVSPRQKMVQLDWPQVRSVVPWLLVPFLLVLTFSLQIAQYLTLDLSGLFLPLAIWMGFRYRKSGCIAFGLGAFPLLFGYALSDVLRSLNEPGYYLLCLCGSRAAGSWEWLERWFERVRRRGRESLVYFLLLPVGVYFSVDAISLGFDGFQLSIALAFLLGFLRKDWIRFLTYALAIAVIIKTASQFGGFRSYLHFSDSLSLAYYLDSLRSIVSLWVAGWVGWRLSKSIGHTQTVAGQKMRGEKASSQKTVEQWTYPAMVYLLILLFTYHQFSIKITEPFGEGSTTFSTTIGLYFLVAYLASIIAGFQLGVVSFGLIAMVAGVIMFLEPSLITTGEVNLEISQKVTLQFINWTMRNLTEFLSCTGCVWVGIYLRKQIGLKIS